METKKSSSRIDMLLAKELKEKNEEIKSKDREYLEDIENTFIYCSLGDIKYLDLAPNSRLRQIVNQKNKLTIEDMKRTFKGIFHQDFLKRLFGGRFWLGFKNFVEIMREDYSDVEDYLKKTSRFKEIDECDEAFKIFEILQHYDKNAISLTLSQQIQNTQQIYSILDPSNSENSNNSNNGNENNENNENNINDNENLEVVKEKGANIEDNNENEIKNRYLDLNFIRNFLEEKMDNFYQKLLNEINNNINNQNENKENYENINKEMNFNNKNNNDEEISDSLKKSTERDQKSDNININHNSDNLVVEEMMKLSDYDMREILNYADIDGDGKISADDFKNLVLNSKEEENNSNEKFLHEMIKEVNLNAREMLGKVGTGWNTGKDEEQSKDEKEIKENDENKITSLNSGSGPILDAKSIKTYTKWLIKEVKKMERKNEILYSFQTFDRNKSGSIDLEIIRSILKNLGGNMYHQILDEILSEYDKNGNGKVDLNEYSHVLTDQFNEAIHLLDSDQY